MLTSTESIVWQRKEYFDDLLNPTDTHSEEEAEPDEFGLGSPITVVKVAGAVKQLRSSSALGVDLSQALQGSQCCRAVTVDTTLHIACTSWTVPLEWHTVPEGVFQLPGDHTL